MADQARHLIGRALDARIHTVSSNKYPHAEAPDLRRKHLDRFCCSESLTTPNEIPGVSPSRSPTTTKTHTSPLCSTTFYCVKSKILLVAWSRQHSPSSSMVICTSCLAELVASREIHRIHHGASAKPGPTFGAGVDYPNFLLFPSASYRRQQLLFV